MRFMIMVKANAESESGEPPSQELFAAMGRFNEELVNAGVLLAGEGLKPSSQGARVRFGGGRRTVVDGPFAETEELLAGFWLIDVKSLDEAIAWVERVPCEEGEVEIRPVFEPADFEPHLSEELHEAELRLRERVTTQQHL
ncbi:YciI family protein [Allokutzneria sp. A3M-2-11 16]|uniref:YciI family protein n=1 Tax=Allokutzneria sp. A3M-2-11 16 TaxID=2962043 RepID=UPI0020B6CC95|nr:YciI family protein [Allokutzneria sp. A3M-2-11 16]MCP3798778.1 YciI family protein [Allokutzneria sp. A3M-2-11 16]